jgi:hypothetical protein
MESPAPSPPWQPLTFGGVAAFARASPGRLFFVQFLMASLVAVSVVWFLTSAWFPQIQKAIAQLPEQGGIQSGQLRWTNASPAWLAEGTFLSIVIDVEGNTPMGLNGDVQLQLVRNELRVRSLFGYLAVPYPAGWVVGLNRTEAGPWWGAWRPFILIGAGVIVAVGLWLSWVVLATIYMAPVRLIAFYADREVSLASAWRVACAAMLPGALLMSGAMVLYSLHRLNLIGLLFAWLLHLVLGWIYVGIAATRLPRLSTAPPRRRNPFSAGQKKTKPRK